MERRAKTRLLVAALAVLAGTSVAAHAQYRRSGDGRLLERDLGVYNSGGLQGRNLNESFRFARNVAFGKAGGGFSFMGDLGTSDYSDFVGGTGSDDLNDFRNRSQTSSLAGRGVRASDTSSYVQSLTAGTRRPNGFKGSFELPSTTYSKSFSFDTTPDFTGLPGIGTRSSGNRRSGLLTDPLGESDRMSRRNLGASGGRSSLSPVDTSGSTRLSAANSSQVDLSRDPLATARQRSGQADTLSGLTGKGLENRGIGVPGTGDNGLNSMRPRSLDDAKRTNESTRQAIRDSSRSRASASPNRVDTSIDTRVPDGNAAMDRPQGSQPLNTSYENLIKRLDQLSKPPDATKDEGTTPPTDIRPGRQPLVPPREAPGSPRLTEPDGGISGGITDLRSRLMRGSRANEDLDSTSTRVKPVEGLVGGSDWLNRRSATLAQSGAVLSSSERAMRESARARATRSVTVTGEGEPATDPNAPRPLPELDPNTLRAIREAGGIVDSFVPVNPGKRDPYTEHVKAGQEAIVNGQFFDADDRFSIAAGIRPSELAPQMGRIHAEIGGAIFRTAANNLRKVFRARPEAAAVRYEAKLLPDKDRLDDVVQRLRLGAQSPGQSGRDAALLMGYIGFQTDNEALRAEGLDLLEKLSDPKVQDSDPRDGVFARFLREVWAKAPPAEQPPAAAPVPQAPTPNDAEKPGK